MPTIQPQDDPTAHMTVVEVFPPMPTITDVCDKLDEYLQIPTLDTYLIVSQHRPQIQRYSRLDAGQWLYSNITALNEEIVIPAIGCTLALADVYRKATFDD